MNRQAGDFWFLSVMFVKCENEEVKLVTSAGKYDFASKTYNQTQELSALV